MAHKTETKTVQRVDERVVEVTCDLCGSLSHKKDHDAKGTDWARDFYDVAEVGVRLSEGSRYPDGGQIETTYVDMCPKCFREKLLPWLASQGVTPHKTTTEW